MSDHGDFRVYGVGFTEARVEPGSTVTIPRIIEHRFKARRLAVLEEISDHFEIVTLTINGKPQVEFEHGPVRASKYRHTLAYATNLSWNYTDPSASILLVVKNIGAKPLPFRAIVTGDAFVERMNVGRSNKSTLST